MWGSSRQQCREEAWINEAIAPHEQHFAWHGQEGSQVVWQSIYALGCYMEDDIVRQTHLLECGWYGPHPTEVEFANTVFVEFFDVSSC
jgi:hypothetical protein